MIKVFNFTNFLKYIKFFIIIIILIICIFFIKNHTANGYSINTEINTVFYSCLDDNISGIKVVNNSNIISTNWLQSVLYSELPIINTNSMVSCQNVNNENNSTILDTSTNTLTYASSNTTTEVIENNVPNTYTNNYNGIEIKNSTNYTISDDDLNYTNLNINKKDIIIFHTHTCESYTPSDTYQYQESGSFRTTDLSRSVVKVGDELSTYLLSYGYNVTHDSTYHDYPSYTGSYGRSMVTVQNLLLSKPNTDVIIDLHRDAISDTSYAPCVKIGDDVVSQLMFVLGTDGGGLEHPNWKNNLKFAAEIQEKANTLYPGLFKPIVLRNSRYNQQLGNAACIIEVGATGNTLDQSMLSMKYLSYVLNEVLKN